MYIFYEPVYSLELELDNCVVVVVVLRSSRPVCKFVLTMFGCDDGVVVGGGVVGDGVPYILRHASQSKKR